MAEPDESAYVSQTTMNFIEATLDFRREMGIHAADDRIFQLGSRQISRRIRSSCSSASLEGNFGGASPRIGMVVDLALAGFSVVKLMRAGPWQKPSTPIRQLLGVHASDGPVSRWYKVDRTHTALHSHQTTPDYRA